MPQITIDSTNSKHIIFRALIRNPLAPQEDIARELGIPRPTLSRKIGDYQLRLR